MIVIANIITLNNTAGAKSDDIDYLGQRRVRFVGEMLQQKVRTGIMQIKRNIQDRMSIIDVDTAMPIHIINQRPLQARIKQFDHQPTFTVYESRKYLGGDRAHSFIISSWSRRAYS